MLTINEYAFIQSRMIEWFWKFDQISADVISSYVGRVISRFYRTHFLSCNARKHGLHELQIMYTNGIKKLNLGKTHVLRKKVESRSTVQFKQHHLLDDLALYINYQYMIAWSYTVHPNICAQDRDMPWFILVGFSSSPSRLFHQIPRNLTTAPVVPEQSQRTWVTLHEWVEDDKMLSICK